MNIDWHSDHTEILLNPRTPVSDQKMAQQLIQALPALKTHFWLSTSGSSGAMKWAALSKKAVLESARAVNSHLECNESDVWLNPLPIFHVGGLGIAARGYLSRAKVYNFSNTWNVETFCKVLEETRTTLTALVPAQIYDIVKGQKKSPASLRGVIVGGGAISEHIYAKACELGWPLLPSYGSTECCSQVATPTIGKYESHELPPKKVLSHLSIKLDEEGHICIKGTSLLTGYALGTPSQPKFVDPKQDGWYHTEDLGIIQDGYLQILGRNDNFIKIGGESVDVLRLEKILEELKLSLSLDQDSVILPVKDDRLGHVIHLASTNRNMDQLVSSFNARVMPYEKIRAVRHVSCIPRSPLNKVLKNKLLTLPIL